MKNIKRVFCLFLAFFITSCGYLPSRYDQTVLDCGEVDRASTDAGGHLVQVERDGNSYDPTRISAKWLENDRETAIKVSSRGCVVTPKSSGVLKLVSNDRKFGQSIDLPASPSLTLLKQTLKPLQSANFRITCRDLMLLRSAEEFSMALVWDALSDAELWQINRLHYQITQGELTIAESTLLLDAKHSQKARLALGPLQLKDGRYSLTAQATTIADEQVNAANSCTFDLDGTAPDPVRILAQTVSPVESALPLHLDGGIDPAFYCIAAANSEDCQDIEIFKPASDFVASPAPGAQILYSYRTDAAGNRSPVTQEPFFRDAEAPDLQFRWLNYQLLQGFNWALEPNQSFVFEVTVDDDSVRSGFMPRSELLEATVCRVSYLDQAGGRFSATQALCTEGRCEGQTMGTWVPCDGLIRFQFQEDGLYPLLRSQVLVEVTTKDLVNRQSHISSDFWVQPEAFGAWQTTEVELPYKETQLNFVNDNFGRFLAFSNSIEGPNQPAPVLLYKDSASPSWSRPLPIASQGQALFAVREQTLLLTPSFNPEVKGDSLWLVGGSHSNPTLVEVPLANDARGKVLGPLEAKAFSIPATLLTSLGEISIWDRVSIQGMTAYQDRQGLQKILLLVSRLSFGSTLNFVFLSFDGRDFSLLGSSTDLLSVPFHNVGPGLMTVPQNQIALIIDGQMAVFDPQKIPLKLRFPQLNPAPAHGLRSLYQDKRGLYGLTQRDLKPFTLTLSSDLARADLQVFGSEDTVRAIDGVWDINMLVRKSDGSFWLSAQSASNAPILFAWKPWSLSRSGWMLQDNILIWGTPTNGVWSSGFGIDQNLDQLAVVTLADPSSGRSGLSLRMMQNSNFIPVTDQGLFRADLLRRPTQKVLVAQDKAGNLIRVSYWRTSDDGLIAISKLGEAGPARTFSLKSLTGGSLIALPSVMNSLFVDREGAVWFEDTLSGSLKRLDPAKRVFEPQFDVSPATRKWRTIDSRGNYWGTVGRPFRQIELRRPDNSRRTLTLAEGFQGERIIWSEPKSWIVARQDESGVSKLFELDMQRETIAEDRQLDQVDAGFMDIIPFQGQRLALVRTSRVNGELKIFEDDGSKWVAWGADRQPQWPDWHPLRQQAILVKDDADAHIFYHEGMVWIAGSAANTGGPILARMQLDSKIWTVFNPGAESLKSAVTSFWVDRHQRLVLSTADSIYFYNPAGQDLSKWIKAAP